MHNVAQNLEAEFNEVDLLPKTKEAAIMATTTYIAAKAANEDEHMRDCRIWRLIRPFCITILYHNLLLFIDIFHI
jgi:hypothetical protein